ncbi:MAG: pilus assembly protein [Planctomycetes bacterium]|nr:pilus assembly protein [Planctomycetota bacterium]
MKGLRHIHCWLSRTHWGQHGQVTVEFALVFPIQLFLTLAVMQLAHMYMAKLVVNHSAFSAARAALAVTEGTDWQGLTWQDRAGTEALLAAAMVCAPITGVDTDGMSSPPSSTDVLAIPGWGDVNSRDSYGQDELARSDIAMKKTRVFLTEPADPQGLGSQVTVQVEHDFQLIFVPDPGLLDVGFKYSGGRLTLASGYAAPHITLREFCTLPRTWNTGSP